MPARTPGCGIRAEARSGAPHPVSVRRRQVRDIPAGIAHLLTKNIRDISMNIDEYSLEPADHQKHHLE